MQKKARKNQVHLPYSRCLRWHIKLHWFCLDCKINTRLLVLVHVILQLCLPELVEGDDDEGNEDVNKEEREDNKEDDVEDALFSPEPGYWSLVLICGGHRVLEDGNPALTGLDCEECQHGHETVVVVEVFPLPPTVMFHRGTLTVHVDKEGASVDQRRS